MFKLGFLGMGNMGYAMLRGASARFPKEAITYTDINRERLEYVKKETNISYVNRVEELVDDCNFILLAIKPQYFKEAITPIKEIDMKDKVIISILPAMNIDSIKSQFNYNIRVVRAMPNTPALVNEGMTGICFSNDNYTKQEEEFLISFFSSFGVCEIIPEILMNAVICASGSSPAYVYMMIEALADSCVKYGMPREKAYTMCAQSVLGAAKMILETKEHPGKLKDQVCSPGGTTIAAVAALEQYGFRNAIIKATDACYEKTISMK